MSDLESLSSEECDTESSSGDEGDNQDEVPTSTELSRTFQKHNETTILLGKIKTVDWWISKCSHRARQRDITDKGRPLAQHHTKTVFPGRLRACRLCSKRKLKTRGRERAKETRDGCSQCQIYLHKDCFCQHHEDDCRTDTTIGQDAALQTDGCSSQGTPETSFARQPFITTPARLRRSPQKLMLSS